LRFDSGTYHVPSEEGSGRERVAIGKGGVKDSN
jgi:hypothetical protein